MTEPNNFFTDVRSAIKTRYNILKKKFFGIYLAIYSITSLYIYINVFFLIERRYTSNLRCLITIILFLCSFMLIRYRYCCTGYTESMSRYLFSEDDEVKQNKEYPNFNIHVSEYIRKKNITQYAVCLTCEIQKPPRAHHCRKCNVCVLKRDHHCDFLNECIGYFNQRPYIIFCIFSVLFSIMCLEAFIVGLINSKDSLFITCYSILIPFSVLNVIFVTLIIIKQFILLLRNETQIEEIAIDDYINKGILDINVFQEGPMTFMPKYKDRKYLNPYNLGWKENLRQVFGSNPLKWLGTDHTAISDGYSFEKNTLDSEIYFFEFLK